MSTGAAQLLAGLLVGLGLLLIGVYIGLGVREGREADRHAKIALARIAARGGDRAPVIYMTPRPAAAPAPAFYRPGYADPFPRAGRFDLEAGYITGTAGVGWPTPELPHDPASRPATSLVDLDGAVRLMCLETEQYIANLIAGTYHAERNGN